jgi:O-acetyl-ADP-ribose deacetylase (regulator of RNase III)
MIRESRGNLLKAPAEALVNTVNTKGIMGKGIALQFRQAFPQMFRAYERACKDEQVALGKMDVHDLGGLAGGPRWIINFPTKGHWKSKSRLEDIESGLVDLTSVIRKLEIKSIAIPPLGCGNGGLPWIDVRPLIEQAFGALPDVEVLLFAPVETPKATAMPNRTEKPKMTPGQAALICLVERYLKGLLDPIVTLLEVHKLMYFLQAAGQDLRLTFEPKQRGPFATNLRHVLIRMESHYTSGYGDGKDAPDVQIELLPHAVEDAEKVLQENTAIGARMDRVASLIEGYEDSYGLELLSSVHWVMASDPLARTDKTVAIEGVLAWNDAKRKRLKPEHLDKAWERLTALGWSEPLTKS